MPTDTDQNNLILPALLHDDGSVVWPFALCQLQVKQPNSLAAIAQALNTDRQIFIVAQRQSTYTETAPTDFYTIGVLARIERSAPLETPDKALEIEVIGLSRATIVAINAVDGYWQATINLIPTATATTETLTKLRQLRELVENYSNKHQLDIGQSAFLQFILEKENCAMAVDGLAFYLNIATAEKQQLLEVLALDERLDRIIELVESDRADLWLEPRRLKDPFNRLEFGRWLTEHQKYPAALMEFIWCFDLSLAFDEGFYQHRRTFLLDYWQALAQVFPPAKEAMRQRRDLLIPLVMSGAAIVEQVFDFTVLNAYLDDEALTLRAYDSLRANIREQQLLRERMFPHVIDQLLAARRFKDAVAGAGDINERVQAIIDHQEQHIRFLKLQTLKEKQIRKESKITRDFAVARICKYYLALIGAHRYEDAAMVVNKLLEFDNSPQAYARLIEGALFVQEREIVKQLINHALESYEEDEKETLRVELEKLGFRIRVR